MFAFLIPFTVVELSVSGFICFKERRPRNITFAALQAASLVGLLVAMVVYSFLEPDDEPMVFVVQASICTAWLVLSMFPFMIQLCIYENPLNTWAQKCLAVMAIALCLSQVALAGTVWYILGSVYFSQQRSEAVKQVRAD